MTTLQRYVLKEVLRALIPTFLVLVFLMTLGFCVQMLNEGLDVVRLAGLPRHVISLAVPVVLPSAMLAAVIMAFGRLSADTEIIAVRVGGVHLLHVIWPVGVLALLVSLLAGYFHFEVQPAARLNIELLQNEAVKQILMDKVALSAKRQFSFPPWYVQYDDYRDGQMQDMLILELSGGMPDYVISARRGRITPDPEQPECVRVRLEDCYIIRPNAQDVTGREPFNAGEISLRAPVASTLGRLLDKDAHLPFYPLWKRLKGAEQAVAKDPQRFANPGREEKETRRKLQHLELQMRPRLKALQEGQDLLRKRREEDERAQSLIRIRQQEILTHMEDLRLWQKELVDVEKAVGDLQGGEGTDARNYDELVKLQRKRDSVRERIRALNTKRAEARAEIETAQRLLARNQTEEKEIQEAAVELLAGIDDVNRRLKALHEHAKQADDQGNLHDLWLRIHKRAAQAMAVFTFAMIGIPLGIMMRRRSILIAFGISFAIVLGIFYPFLIFGQVISEGGILPTGPAMWSGNAVTFAIGLALMYVTVRK